MAQKYKDFDAMFAEMKVETVPFKVFGKVYHIRKEIPAVVVLEMSRMESSDAIPTQLMFKAAEMIFGKSVLDEITKHEGFSAEMLAAMIKWAFEAINGVDHDETEDGGVTEDDTGAVKGKN